MIALTVMAWPFLLASGLCAYLPPPWHHLFVTLQSKSTCQQSVLYTSIMDCLNPLTDCAQLQRVGRGIKRSQGLSTKQSRLPMTKDILLVIFSSLNMSSHNDITFRAACTLAYFGFLRASEFTTPSLAAFNPKLHLSISDIAVDSHTNPTILRVHIKASKTGPFPTGFVHLHRPR